MLGYSRWRADSKAAKFPPSVVSQQTKKNRIWPMSDSPAGVRRANRPYKTFAPITSQNQVAPANPGSSGIWPLNQCVCECVCVYACELFIKSLENTAASLLSILTINDSAGIDYITKNLDKLLF